MVKISTEVFAQQMQIRRINYDVTSPELGDSVALFYQISF